MTSCKVSCQMRYCLGKGGGRVGDGRSSGSSSLPVMSVWSLRPTPIDNQNALPHVIASPNPQPHPKINFTAIDPHTPTTTISPTYITHPQNTMGKKRTISPTPDADHYDSDIGFVEDAPKSKKAKKEKKEKITRADAKSATIVGKGKDGSGSGSGEAQVGKDGEVFWEVSGLVMRCGG